MTFSEMLERATEAMTVRRVFGDPIEKDGVTIIPVAKVRGGGGGGSGEGPDGRGRGWGGGFGVSATPAGVFLLRAGEVSWRPAVDANRAILIWAIVALLTIRALTSKR